MSSEKYNISRRRLLGSAGVIGGAAAIGGTGTMAFFSDEENFANNQLTAGELDLKVDWEEHYSDWSEDEAAAVDSGEVQMPSSGSTLSSDEIWDGYVGLPDPNNAVVAVPSEDLADFMDATSIEAYPDTNDDGIQDAGQYESVYSPEYPACEKLADTPEDMDPNGGKQLRTANEDTLTEAGDPKPLVSLDDVKPGDFGELTLSFHLCDNPGYVWMNGELDDASENGYTEPEMKDRNESLDGDGDGVDDRVELLDEMQTLLWYDEDGDNVFEPGGQAGGQSEQVDIVLVLDRSGSMSYNNKLGEAKSAAKNLIDSLNLGSNAAQIGVVSFSEQERLDQGLTTDASAAKTAIDGLSPSGTTNIEGGVNGGEEELTGTDLSADVSASGNHRNGARKMMVVLSDGSPNEDDDGDGSDDPVDEADRAKANGIEMFTVGFDVNTSTAQTLEDMASDPKDSHFYLGASGELTNIFGQIGQQVAGEQAFFRGSLRELLTELSDGHGIPLDGDRTSPYDEIEEPDDADSRDCFVDSTTNAVALAWYLPVNHGNEVQGDSVSFDLGFYTEQCRHNDGSGQSAA